MTTKTQTQVAAALGINVLALWSLSSNPQFPTPASGNGQNVLWNTSDITTFTALWTAAKANGWKISTAELPVFNFTRRREPARRLLSARTRRSVVRRLSLSDHQMTEFRHVRWPFRSVARPRMSDLPTLPPGSPPTRPPPSQPVPAPGASAAARQVTPTWTASA
jgi:predicted DNA-binding transcriptional regulator AlpA